MERAEDTGMELKATEYELVGRTAVIRLARPHRGNAWTGRMHAEYVHLVGLADADPDVRVVVVTGAGKAFCVGGDSEALSGHAERGSYDDGLTAGTEASAGSSSSPGDDVPAGHGLHPEFETQMAFHYGLSKPVIAAINGPAAGIGLALACFADLRFARPGAKLTTAHGKLNLPAEYGLSWLLPRHVGLTRAMDLLLTSRVFLTDEAAELGLINELFPTDELLDRTMAYAEQLASTVSAGSLRATRHQVYLDLHRGVGVSVDDSRDRLDVMMGEPDYAEGVAALREKRPPAF
ncbi:MAG: enoyl-CoA hydratase-related protein [Actinomycetota bacterium]